LVNLGKTPIFFLLTAHKIDTPKCNAWGFATNETERQTMEHEYQTTLNGGIVTVTLDLDCPSYLDRLMSVWFEGTDITSILDKQTLTALSMEAERAYSGDIRE
jgi:hypothetical protein